MQGSRQIRTPAAEHGERVRWVAPRPAGSVLVVARRLETERQVTHLVTSDPEDRGRVYGHLAPGVGLAPMRYSTVTAARCP
ncbi:MAG: hypothetical protein QOF82_1974 [Frankiales bacterium]|jgi:hypothetical protein|nr:hypothetical protein [Frankiales bacterium]MDX6208435.1 hypothetical protein [Frankiales bacterium]MDX6212887.1 hypothetical protein [Frankiales bacterium]MDX6221139.1 hypothetical protein [Frankiales bacterium]